MPSLTSQLVPRSSGVEGSGSGRCSIIVSTPLDDGEVMPLVRKTIESSKKNHDFFAVNEELSGAKSMAATPVRPSPVPPTTDRVPMP